MRDWVRVLRWRGTHTVRGVCRWDHMRRRAVYGDVQRAVPGWLLLPCEHGRDALWRRYLQQHDGRYSSCDMPHVHCCGRVLLRASKQLARWCRVPCRVLLHRRGCKQGAYVVCIWHEFESWVCNSSWVDLFWRGL